MPSKRTGLGKGLGALIPSESMERIENRINDHGELIQALDINLIVPNKDQPRRHFDSERLDALADSIQEVGLLQPIVVKRNGSVYEIIAGERRWRASKQLGNKTIDAIIKDVDAFTIAQLALIENLQREDLNAIEEADAYKKLIEEYEITQEKLSKIVGKSRSYITNTMRLLKLEPEFQDAITTGIISNGHGRALLALDSLKKRKAAFDKIIEGNLSVRQAESLVKAFELPKKVEKHKKTSDKLPEIAALEEDLSIRFGTRVMIQEKLGKGKLTIDFYDLDDLNRILEFFKEE